MSDQIPSVVAKRYGLAKKIQHLLDRAYNYDTLGAKNGATVTCSEKSWGPIHHTKLTLTATPISVADDANVAQYGGAGKVYDFPAGFILFLGAVVSGTCTMGATGTIIDAWAGGFSLGSVAATTGSTLVSTEADFLKEVDIAASTSKVGTLAGVNAATQVTESGALWYDGTTTAADMYFNLVIDDDASHTAATGTFTGTIEFWWINLGDK